MTDKEILADEQKKYREMLSDIIILGVDTSAYINFRRYLEDFVRISRDTDNPNWEKAWRFLQHFESVHSMVKLTTGV